MYMPKAGVKENGSGSCKENYSMLWKYSGRAQAFCLCWMAIRSSDIHLPALQPYQIPSQDAEKQIQVYQEEYTPATVANHHGYVGAWC